MIQIKDFMVEPYAIRLDQLGIVFPGHNAQPPTPSSRPLAGWSMERDDGPIFEYFYKSAQPRRHLEFGTWQGWGTALCLESCSATVWTLNLPDGESKPDGSWAYGERILDARAAPTGEIVSVEVGEDQQGKIVYHRTDAGAYVGRNYREKGLGFRVCQIYCDSRDWDISNYPADFFDSVLIDGGHQPDVVVSDTRKALKVLRPGGLILWHDFCPAPEIRAQFFSAKGVTEAIEMIIPELEPQLARMCWINPSWILMGIKK